MACSKLPSLLIVLWISYSALSCKYRDGNDYSSIPDRKKYLQYITAGKQLYLEHCGNCHQDDGAGLARLYPPLKNSDFMNADPERTLCIIKFGQRGMIKVNGVEFNMEMPSNSRLSGLELAEIATYVFSTFGNKPVLVTPDQMEALEPECKNSVN
ncbi:MAG TPA: cytochrome c [Cyclobacteriaceae bacterium]|nr:cytochrome c [Cyclobacteriaceae bacterium]